MKKLYLLLLINLIILNACNSDKKEKYVGKYGDKESGEILIEIMPEHTGHTYSGNANFAETGDFKWEPNNSNGITLKWENGISQDVFLTEDAPIPYNEYIKKPHVLWTLVDDPDSGEKALGLMGDLITDSALSNSQTNDPPLIFGIYMTKDKIKNLNKGLPYDSLQNEDVTFITYKRKDHQQSFLFKEDNICFMMKMIYSPSKETLLKSEFDKALKKVDDNIWVHDDSVTRWVMLVNDKVLIVNVTAA